MNGAHLATATGTPDSSASNLLLAHICRMNAAFQLEACCNLVAVTRCARMNAVAHKGIEPKCRELQDESTFI